MLEDALDCCQNGLWEIYVRYFCFVFTLNLKLLSEADSLNLA